MTERNAPLVQVILNISGDAARVLEEQRPTAEYVPISAVPIPDVVASGGAFDLWVAGTGAATAPQPFLVEFIDLSEPSRGGAPAPVTGTIPAGLGAGAGVHVGVNWAELNAIASVAALVTTPVGFSLAQLTVLPTAAAPTASVPAAVPQPRWVVIELPQGTTIQEVQAGTAFDVAVDINIPLAVSPALDGDTIPAEGADQGGEAAARPPAEGPTGRVLLRRLGTQQPEGPALSLPPIQTSGTQRVSVVNGLSQEGLYAVLAVLENRIVACPYVLKVTA